MLASKVLLWICRLLIAVILLQTLFFKFTAAPESVFIFSSLGVEPWGRILSGVLELIASILVLIPPMSVYGALLSAGIMAGALLSHVFVLGIEVQNDGGQLFIYALIVLVASIIILMKERKRLFFSRS
ncbi:MAG TPA: DoxX family protein [Flavitalea sp.]|nr:DoxX family protein [Flavitalea sp.]